MNIIGKTIANRYEIISQTGVGGMATVYVAKDKSLNREVAVKVLKDEFTTDDEFVKRFNSEALAAASLSHANIVSIYDVGNEDGIYYIVMELVRGKTLKEIINEEREIPWKWSINIAKQIASALETAHKNNIVHRDIKPHNIIITEDGVAKVTDFGIAKAVSNSTITAFGTTIGSVHYFSPEQAKGGITDARTDIYSLGVVMYEMLTGRVPFDSDTSVSVALKHMQEDPVAPIKINEQIPKAVNDIILKAMQKGPLSRYQTASEMIVDLNKALQEPNGDFVKEDNFSDGLTRRMDAITDDMLDESKTKSKSHVKEKEKNKFIQFFEKHKKTKILLIILLCIAIFTGSIGITSYMLNKNLPKDIQVPNLINLTEEEAKKVLEENNLSYEKLEDEYNKDVEAGKIFEQNPPYSENYTVKENSKIKIKISKGTEKTIVPKVMGMTFDEAVKALADAKLKFEKIEETSKTIEEGIVISQEIQENTEANAGDIVKIHVSIGTGIPQVAMPRVILKKEADAKKELEDKKLKVKVEYAEDYNKDNGVVLKQSVEPDENIDEGTEVTIVVNKLDQVKTAIITVDVKSYTGGYKVEESNKPETDNNDKENSNTEVKQEKKEEIKEPIKKTCRLTIKVGDRTFMNEKEVDKNSIIKQEIRGIGNVHVEIIIDGESKAEQLINLNTTSEYTFKK